MRKLTSLLLSLLLCVTMFAQSPDSFTYQAQVLNTDGSPKAGENVVLNISILKGSAIGDNVYTETHNTSTNSHGLVNVLIGEGGSSDDFSTIDWSAGIYFVTVEVDGTLLGTSQLLSVPYAKYADKAGNAFSGSYSDLSEKPDFTNWDKDGSDDFSGKYSDLSGTPDLKDTASYIKAETDPEYSKSVAASITTADTAKWNRGVTAMMSAFQMPVGSIIPFAGPADNIPVEDGWMLADGSALSSSDYPMLYMAIGTAWGNGSDGSGTDFNLPDLRGMFLRGISHSTSRDPGRTTRTAIKTGGNTGNNVGSYQADAFQNITGTIYNTYAATGRSGASGVFTGSTMNGGSTVSSPSYSTSAAMSILKFDASKSSGARTASETRPDNVYVVYMVKVK